MSDEKTIKEVTKERDELFSKVVKLVSFTTEQSVPDTRTITDRQYILLLIQQNVMQSYIAVLNARLIELGGHHESNR